jgi:lipopolysaccharide export system protein LptA
MNPNRVLVERWKRIFASCLFVIVFLFVQHLAAEAQEQTIRLIHADSLVGYTRGNDNYRELIGHVKMQRGNTVLSCDTAVQNLTQDIVDLYGDVNVEDDTLTLLTKQARYFSKAKLVSSDTSVYLNDRHRTLTANRGSYDTEAKVAQFHGNVFVRDSTSQLRAQQLTYFRREDKTVADSDVQIKNLENNITVYGCHFEDYGKRNFSVMTGSPLLIQIDTSSDGKIDTLLITARRMEAYRDSANERFVADDSVQIIRDSLSARCGHGIYFSNDSVVVLQNDPIVWYGDNQLTGDSVAVHIHNKRVTRVDVSGSAFAVERSDSIYSDRFNQIKGKVLTMFLVDREIDRIVVENNATSLYYLYDKDKPNGLNRVSGDRVIMYFKGGKIDRIAVISGVEGNYYPEKLVRNRVSSYNLSGFVYYENRPLKSDFSFPTKKSLNETDRPSNDRLE